MDSTSQATEELTPAQRLLAQHHTETEELQPTIEEVVDEEDIEHPPPSAQVASTPATNPSSMSAKAAGKQKEPSSAPTPKPRPALDTQSEEAFPSLGAPKTQNSASASAWSKKPSSVRNVQANGAANQGSNGSSGNSTPRSYAPNGRGNIMAIPGRSIQEMHIQSSQLKTQSDLKKPLSEILKEINRRSKAKVDMRSAGAGVIVFTGQGPSDDSVREVLKEIISRVGAKVSYGLEMR